MFTDLTREEVGRIVAQSAGREALGYLTDPAARAQAAKSAQSQGLTDWLREQLTPAEPIAVAPYSRFRDYRRNGDRTRYERIISHRTRQTDWATMACLLGMDYRDYLQDLLWAECEKTWWIYPAHEGPGRTIDLFAAMNACRFATVLRLLGDELDAEVRERMEAEVRTRVFDEYLNPEHNRQWHRGTHNWNAVCNGAVGTAFLLLEKDPDRLADVVWELLQAAVPYLEHGFEADGGCSEGPGYWRFGFGWYVTLATALHEFTDGRIDLMEGERIGNVCRFPLAVAIEPGQEIGFADAHSGYVPYATAAMINRFRDLPELYALCEPASDGSARIRTVSDLLLHDGEKLPAHRDRADYLLPDLAVVKARRGEVTFAAKAGHNREHHNHNDVGSFLLHRGRTCFLTDPGAPVYSARTFSSRRYESVFCNSFGHSVPVVNGLLQAPGEEYAGSLAVEGLNADAPKTATIELAGAYPAEAGVETLTRTLELDGEGLTIADRFVFADQPRELEEALMTVSPAEAIEDGRAVRIESETGDGTVEVRAETPGRFAVAELAAESEAESRAGELLRRIAFTPERLEKDMTVRLTARFVGE